MPGQAATAAEAELGDRARAFWLARVEADWRREYGFYHSDHVADVSAERYLALRHERGPFRYLSARVGEVVVRGDLGWVEVTYSAEFVEFPTVPARTQSIWDVWRHRDGAWYPLQDAERKLFPRRPLDRTPPAAAAALRGRVEDLWSARAQQDWALVYEYLEPDYRSAVPLAEFTARRALYRYSSHAVEWVEVIGNTGRVKVRFDRTLNDPTLHKLEAESASVVEEWSRIDGEWFRRPAGS